MHRTKTFAPVHPGLKQFDICSHGSTNCIQCTSHNTPLRRSRTHARPARTSSHPSYPCRRPKYGATYTLRVYRNLLPHVQHLNHPIDQPRNHTSVSRNINQVKLSSWTLYTIQLVKASPTKLTSKNYLLMVDVHSRF
jgi:hypothetical protein